MPAGAPLKHIPAAVQGAGVLHANHVSKLAPANVQSLEAQGFAILDNREGRLLLQSVVDGKVQQLLIADAKLRSGKEVVGFGIAQPGVQATESIFGTTAEAASRGFGWCSYVWMNSRWDDLHVHLCAVDAPYVLAIAIAIETAVAAVIGLAVGIGCLEICGPLVGIAVVTTLSIETIGWFWLHTDRYGNVDLVIPNWTMQQPYGGNVLWVNSGLWDYMYNQCWIREAVWYDPYCY